jgi:hypothetical protein
VSPPPLTTWRGLVGLNRLDPKLTARAGVDAEPPAAIGVQRNTVDCGTASEGPTGWALLLATAPEETGGASVTATGNRLASPRSLIAAVVSGSGAASVTGNIIAGALGNRQIGLAVVATKMAAVTGNVVTGRAVLPPRGLAAPFVSWVPFNEVVF